MNINTYRKFTGVTCKDLGDPIQNSIHFVLGVSSEVLHELNMALRKEDKVNIGEELGDANWFLSQYANNWDLVTPDNYNIDLTPEQAHDLILMLLMNIGEMLNLDKGALVYNKEVSKESRQELLDDVWAALELIALGLDLDSNKIRATNINKLKARFGDKFDEYKAKNRDLTKELEVLSV